MGFFMTWPQNTELREEAFRQPPGGGTSDQDAWLGVILTGKTINFPIKLSQQTDDQGPL